MENQLYVCYARISKEQGAKAQHRYGRELLKQALKTVYQLEITEQEIVCAQGGKPMLTSGWPWFNISHCRGLVACAVSPCPVGLDVESSRRVTPALVRRACCQKEMQYVENGLKIPQEEGKQLFSSDGRQALLEEQNDGRRAALEEKRDGTQIGSISHKSRHCRNENSPNSNIVSSQPWNDNSVLFFIVPKLHNKTYTI